MSQPTRGEVFGAIFPVVDSTTDANRATDAVMALLAEHEVEPERCEAGHTCCGHVRGEHDHFLEPADCPACGYPEAQP